MTESRSNCIALIAALVVLCAPSALLAQMDDGCTQLTSANATAGLYVKRGADQTPVPVNGSLAYDINLRFYFIPTAGPRVLGENQEAAYHVRSQTTADSDLRADEALVYRPRVQTSCRAGRFAGRFIGDTFEDFDRNTRYVSLGRYFDHHAENESERRPDRGLRTYFHFEISDADNNCFRTDDAHKVGPLHSAYGFPDVSPPRA